MSEKEGNDVTITEKSEEMGETLTNEDTPASLETIPSETPLVRNGVQVASKDRAKIDILLKATGNAPIMKQKKWSVSQDYCIGRISDFIRRYLKLDSNEKLFLYVNQTFAPAPDQVVKNLYDCYGADGKLILHYCKSQAWG
ncbi:autophagy protein 12-like [Bombus vosnesenskii]|uniref:Ubiquitin-like protein ATG12 n=2 Tax=Pyrobombus TaxID=144703 RepID=A0A6J3LL25_9HYME|nr:autophagy protein 12-like [Bombus impatiens]XP_033366097.1 autophagy protein 12-like [Bombus vosnesenskii]XP_050489886.1 autophagy protein 12-like [Bombus huntii]